jgi:hypothetical protein
MKAIEESCSLCCSSHSPEMRRLDHLIFNAKGHVITSEAVLSHFKTFCAQFADSKFYFNHWITVRQFVLLNVKCLLSLNCHGAAVQCANSQHTIDKFMPFLLRGNKLSRDNLGVYMWQAKNDPWFTSQYLTMIQDLLWIR